MFDIEKALLSISDNKNPFAYSDLGVLVTKGLEALMLIAAIATLVYLFWGGLEWIISGGDKAGTERARSKITDAVIGLFVVFSAWAIFQLLQGFLGFWVTEKTSSTSTSTGSATSSSKCEVAKDNWVSQKSGCNTNPTDWNCWRDFIIKNPCLNFNDGTGSYWPHQGCATTQPNICQ